MAILHALAGRLARTRLGQRALAQADGLDFFKRKPSPRLYLGLVLMALSYVLGLPGMALCAYLSLEWKQPLILVIGGPLIFGLVHLIFGLGAWLAGANYAKALLLLAIKKFLARYALDPEG